MREDILYWMALTKVPGVGNITGRAIVEFAGSAAKAFDLNVSRLSRFHGIHDKLIKALREFSDFTDVEKELAFMERENIRPYTIMDEEYPERLKDCSDAPLVLYSKGNADLNAKRTLAIVGTRHASAYGKAVTQQIVRDLREFDVTIVSGMAFGIDIAAHQEALNCGLPTIAVFAHGLDRIYPHQHRSSALKILENGAWLTEYPSGGLPDKMNFPMRNRIVAGMCDATLVVESAEQGGAMITAALAAGYNREVLAVPGPVNAEFSRGCNILIKRQVAQMVENAEDVIKALGWDNASSVAKPVQTRMPLDLTEEETTIYQLLQSSGETGIDTLSETTGWDSGWLASWLLSLECKGIIRMLPGKRYVIL